MDIVELYEDEQFNNLLEVIAQRKNICPYDDFRQDVFLEIIERGYSDRDQFRKAAERIASRYYRENRDDDVMRLAYENENGELETDDEVMARLVHSGKGKYIS
jgi:hypothetical protein